VLEDKLADPAWVDRLTRFVRASMKGWDSALANPDEAAQIVVDSDDSEAAELAHQQYMMGEVAKLVGSDAKLNIDDYNQTVQTLLSAAGSETPTITKEPTGAY